MMPQIRLTRVEQGWLFVMFWGRIAARTIAYSQCSVLPSMPGAAGLIYCLGSPIASSFQFVFILGGAVDKSRCLPD
jgi:hypothetical protein